MQALRGVQLTNTNRSCGLIAFFLYGKSDFNSRIVDCSLVSICSFQRMAGKPDAFFINFSTLKSCCPIWWHTAVVRPVPIPNTAVKHSMADGSGCIASARVGSRQSFKKARRNFFRLFYFSKLAQTSDADVFIPELRTRDDEIFHQLNAHRVVHNFHRYALGAHIGFRPLEGQVFADDNPRDFVE